MVSVLVCIAALCQPLRAQDGEVLAKTHCAICHDAGTEDDAPDLSVLGLMSAEQIFTSLERGVMQSQGVERSRAEKRALAEALSGGTFSEPPVNPMSETAFCKDPATRFQDSLDGPGWNGCGVTPDNARFQPRQAAGLSATDVPRLELRWAFGFPGASSSGVQPVVSGGRIYVGSWEGDLYSLDARTGCIHWLVETESGVPAAIRLSKVNDEPLTAFFGDLAANVYAVNAETGALIWKVKVDDYPLARIRGSVAFHDGKVFVPVSSREESQVRNPRYPCCRFRGSMVALNATTGEQLWKTYTIARPAEPTKQTRIGTQMWGPAGVAVWVAPTLDPRRNLLYVGSGNNYSFPSTPLSDSIIAFDMDTGAVVWSRQMTEGDIWTLGCRAVALDPATCPDADAPDFDFVASPILVDGDDVDPMLIVSQKSGIVFALDPNEAGKTIWQQRVGEGGTQGGIMFGPATDGETLYVAVSDFARIDNQAADPAAGGGMAALDLRTGRILWHTPAPGCGDRSPCSPAQGAAVTAIPGVAFSGSVDGHLRAYDAQDGKILWDFDTVRDYISVNGVSARGGSLCSGGATVVNGMVFASSGYSHHGGVIPGNVLLAFAPSAR